MDRREILYTSLFHILFIYSYEIVHFYSCAVHFYIQFPITNANLDVNLE
jgi:hypothetical protein